MYEERSTSPPANDTIVVEQWTVIEVSVCSTFRLTTTTSTTYYRRCRTGGLVSPTIKLFIHLSIQYRMYVYFIRVLSLQGSNVKTDYGPLLHTLAEFGWLLTCVLPTPIIRHDR